MSPQIQAKLFVTLIPVACIGMVFLYRALPAWLWLMVLAAVLLAFFAWLWSLILVDPPREENDNDYE